MVLFEVLHNTYVGKNCPIVSKGGVIKKNDWKLYGRKRSWIKL